MPHPQPLALMEVRSRRVGGAIQVPREVPQNRRLALAYRWLIGSARAKKGRPMQSSSLTSFSWLRKNEGDAIKKKDEMHRMADAKTRRLLTSRGSSEPFYKKPWLIGATRVSVFRVSHYDGLLSLSQATQILAYQGEYCTS